MRRYNRGMRLSTVIAAALVLAQIASGQPNPDPADPIYHVEVILFAFNDGNPTEEDLHHDRDGDRQGPPPELLTLPDIALENVFGGQARDAAGIPDGVAETADTAARAVTGPADTVAGPASDSLELFETAAGLANAGADGAPPGFRPLLRSELELSAEKRELDRLSAYTVLAHAGWAQAGVDSERAVPLDLKRIGITNPRGTIEVYLGRFLHARLDLEFLRGTGTLWQSSGGAGLAPLDYAETYRLTDVVEAMRSGELHQADHPLYGVLIRITPEPEPDEDPAG